MPLNLKSVANGSVILNPASTVTDKTITIPATDGTMVVQDGTNTTTLTNVSYSGTLTGGTGVVNIGSGQVYKDASGNVGVGTSTPNVGLTVNAKAVSAGYVVPNADIAFPPAYSNGFFRAVGNYQVGSGVGGTIQLGGKSYSDSGINAAFLISAVSAGNATDALTFSTQTSFNNVVSERMRIDSSGNVGIGTSSPASKLHVSNGDIQLSAGNLLKYSSTAYMTPEDNSIGARISTPGAFTVWTGGTPQERARIDSSGSLRVGTTGGWTAGGSITSIVGYSCKAGGTGAFSGNGFNINWTGSAQLWIDETNVGTITLTSDYRIKKNITTQTAPALERVMQLRPVNYELKDYGTLHKADGVAREGFIAHELAEIIPSAVDGEKDAQDQIQSLRLDALCSVLTKAIQELKAEFDAYKLTHP